MKKLEIKNIDVQDLRDEDCTGEEDIKTNKRFLGLVQVSIEVMYNGKLYALCLQNDNDFTLCYNSQSGDESDKFKKLASPEVLEEVLATGQKAFDDYMKTQPEIQE